MAKHDQLQSCLMFARTATVEMFEQRWPGHFFLGQWPSSSGEDERMSFTTGVIDIKQLKAHQLAPDDRPKGRGEVTVYKPGVTFLQEIKKSARNTWLEWISIGRAGNNDVILRHGSVSKLHARIHVGDGLNSNGTADSEYWLTDVKSTHGTKINGNRIEPSKAERLKSGDFTHFGQLGCTFLDAAGLYHRLRALR